MFKGGQKSGFPAAILSAMCSGDNSVEITEQESRFNAADEKQRSTSLISKCDNR